MRIRNKNDSEEEKPNIEDRDVKNSLQLQDETETRMDLLERFNSGQEILDLEPSEKDVVAEEFRRQINKQL